MKKEALFFLFFFFLFCESVSLWLGVLKISGCYSLGFRTLSEQGRGDIVVTSEKEKKNSNLLFFQDVSSSTKVLDRKEEMHHTFDCSKIQNVDLSVSLFYCLPTGK